MHAYTMIHFLTTLWSCVYRFILTLPSLLLSKYLYFYFIVRLLGIPMCFTTHLNATHVVLLIHGRNGMESQCWPLFYQLSQSLNSDYSITAINMGNGSNAIADDVNTLIQHLNQTYGQEKMPRFLHIVGISKGGVTAAALSRYLLDMEYNTSMKESNIDNEINVNNIKNNDNNNMVHFKVKQLITIASPLKGTDVAFYAPCATTRKELSSNNAMVVDMATSLKKYSDTLTIHHIVNKFDHLIIPNDHAMYNFTSKSNIYNHDTYTSHGVIQYDPKVMHQISQWILHDQQTHS